MATKKMRFTYDEKVDAAYVYMKEKGGMALSTKEIFVGTSQGRQLIINVDFGSGNSVVGIEVIRGKGLKKVTGGSRGAEQGKST